MRTLRYQLHNVQWQRLLLLAVLVAALALAAASIVSLPDTAPYLAGHVASSHPLHQLVSPHPLSDGSPTPFTTCGGGVDTHC